MSFVSNAISSIGKSLGGLGGIAGLAGLAGLAFGSPVGLLGGGLDAASGFAASEAGTAASGAAIEAGGLSAGSDAIGNLINMSNYAGTTATPAAQALGFNTPEAAIGSIQPGELSASGLALSGLPPGTPPTGSGTGGPEAGVDGFQTSQLLGTGGPAAAGGSVPNFLQRLMSLSGGLGGGTAGSPGLVSGALGAFGGVNSIYQSEQLRKMLPQLLAQNDPFGSQRGQYQQQLQQLMANPSSVTSLPGYQFQFDQGQQALQRQMAAGGYGGTGAAPGTGGGSGNYGTALTQYGQGFAQNFYQQQLANLSGLSGANIQPGNIAGNAIAGTSAANQGTLGGLGALAYGAQRFLP